MNLLPLLITLLVLFGCTPAKKETASNQKPNILFLFADDFTYDAIGALGNQVVQTPNLDRLVQSGVTFSNTYNMGGWNGAICVASRAMIISGASLWSALEQDRKWREADGKNVENTWGKLMEGAGYQTYMTGKWHVQADAQEVFQTVRDIRPGMPRDNWVGNDTIGKILTETFKKTGDISGVLPAGYNRPLSETDSSWSPTDPKFGGFWEGGKHWSEVVKDHALDFLKQASEREDPFFMYLAFNAPHDPRQAPQEYLDLYPVESIPLPSSWLPEYPFKDSIGNTPLLRDEALAPYPRTEYAIRTHIREYYAIISHLDQQIGEILDALEASGRMDNTYIFFTGDHGLSVGRHGLLGKQSLFDHSIRVPLMVSGPNITGNTKVEADVYLQDIMATSLELAGIKKPDHVFFNSFLDLATGQVQSGHYDEIYGAYVNFQRMIRKDGFKLMVYPKIEKALLFDLANDPYEMNDLSENPEYAEKKQSLFDDLVVLQEKMHDTLKLAPLTSN